MIVNVINIGGIRTLKPKYQAPVAVNRNREKPAPVSGQGVQSPTRRIQVLGSDGMFQRGQLHPQLAGVLRLDAAFRVGLKETLQPLVPEVLDHGQSVKWYLTLVTPTASSCRRPSTSPCPSSTCSTAEAASTATGRT